MDLLPHQIPWLSAISSHLLQPKGRLLNALCTGSGKTYLAAEAMRQDPRPTVIIAPKSTLTNWERVLEGFNVADQVHELVNPERISRGISQVYSDNSWRLPRDGRLIWDEVHKSASGPKSIATTALVALRNYSGQVMPMSATLASTPLALRAVGALFGLHDGTPQAFYQWCIRHDCKQIQTPDGRGLRWVFRPQRDTMTRIHAQFMGRILSVTQDDIPNFPATQIRSQLYDLPEVLKHEIQRAYEEMPDRIKDPGSNQDVARLRARQRAEWCKTGLLVSLVRDSLDEGLSPVVFTCFRDTLARLRQELDGTPVAMIYGDQPREERQAAIDNFQANRVHVMLATLDAGGVGIDLHDVHNTRRRVSFLTPGDNASAVVQALGRVWRQGGTPTVQTFVLAAGTVEERIHKSLERKLKNINTLNSGDLQP